MKEFIECITKKYACFRGRAGMREYGAFVLANVLLCVPIHMYAICLMADGQMQAAGNTKYYITYFITLLFELFLAVPFLAVTVRRLHDTGRCWAWLLAGYIPLVFCFVRSTYGLLIGVMICAVYAWLPGTEGTNKYGPAPREE